MASPSLKRKSDALDAYQDDGMKTPTGSPSRKKMRITRNQKQALVDNLQLEITERARKLRAQYALQTHDLRARIERRVNRIPVPLRKANMGELLEKHSGLVRAQASPRKITSPAKSSRNITNISVDNEKQKTTAAAASRRVKKPSHEGVYSDKENAPAAGETLEGLSNPKRRLNGTAGSGTSRVVSQESRGPDYRILSPKSLNSRTYPQSPFRNSPEKSQQAGYLSKPISPFKPSSPLRATSSANSGANGATAANTGRYPSQTARPTSRAGTGTKGVKSPLPRPATRQRERRNSASSNASSGTTVVKPTKTATGARKATNTSTTAAKKTTAVRTQAPSSTVKKTAATTTAIAAGKRAPTPSGETSAAGRSRTLRKRA